MNIALKTIAGPLKGQIIPLEKPITMGRKGDLVLEDPKVSGIHCHIGQSSSGRWMAVDNESKNGIRVNDIRVKSVTLTPGVVFYVGDSGFEVFSLEPKPKAEAKPKKQQKLWYQALAEFIEKNKKAFKDRSAPLSPLEPALVLEFVRGVQMNPKWILGYGPRKLGAASIDLPLWEPGTPDIAFEIRPTVDGILFTTAHPDIVKLNDESVDSQVLRVGDTISIKDTLIEIDFTG